MKKLFVLPLALLTLVTSCVAPSAPLTPEQQHQQTVTRIEVATEIVGRRIAASSNDQAKIARVKQAVSEIKTLVEQGGTGSGDVLNFIVDRLAPALSEKERLNLKDGAQLITLLVGPITVDVSGVLEQAQKDYVLAFLTGLDKGLAQQ